ncbi:hypothetical protein [Actinomadura mexicana]|uniref:Uncharacterized protein n=1 Tax=Actinomadura mexicana TaxID=134959 RepID=A0A238YSK8_9ACTN|nr:hypothetical protein [Actinomadura mexicana]SNR73808.1 hypothetical protein SAMN06265355_106183 [Actinomadura mexicana]
MSTGPAEHSVFHAPGAPVRVHGRMEPESIGSLLHESVHEPSLTLCSLDAFARYAGPVGAAALDALLTLGALDEIIDSVRADRGLVIRITVAALWLDRGQVPGARPDWHIDRAGAITGAGARERYDTSDLTRRRSFALVSLFSPEEPAPPGAPDASTEFAVAPGGLPLPGGWARSRDVAEHIRTWLSAGRSCAPCGDGRAVSFGARAVHRPGAAPVPGWRILVRAGAYQSDPPMSPYEERIPACNPFCRRTGPGFWLRPVGTRERATPMRSWSVRAGDDAAVEELFARRSLRPAPAPATAAITRIRDACA